MFIRLSLAIAFTALLITGCATGPNLASWLDEPRPPYTTSQQGTIVRGDVRIPINFENPEDLAQIQDYDHIELEVATYLTLPTTAAKGLTFIGQDRLTSVGRVGGGPNFLMQTRDTRFWNVWLGQGNFENQEGLTWCFNCRVSHSVSFTADPNSKSRFHAGMFFTNYGYVRSFHSDSWWALPNTASLANYTFFNHDVAFKKPVKGHQYYSYLNQWNIDSVASLENYASEARKAVGVKNDGSFPNQAFMTELLTRMSGVLDEIRTTKMPPHHDPGHYGFMEDAFIRLADYARLQTGISTDGIDGKKIESLLAKAKANREAGNLLVSMVLLNQASKESLGGVYPGVSEELQKTSVLLSKQYGCHVDASSYPEANLQRGEFWLTAPVNKKKFDYFVTSSLKKHHHYWADQNYPLLAVGSRQSDCQIKLAMTQDAYSRKENTTSQVTESEWAETGESRHRREMLQRAASEAAQKARMAQWNAASESMKDTARKMYDYRVQEVNVGGTKMLQYGVGDFGGKASAGTRASIEHHTGQSRRLLQQAQGAEYEEVFTTTTTFHVNYTFALSMAAEVAHKGHPTRRYQGPVSGGQWSNGPCTRTDRSQSMNCNNATRKGTNDGGITSQYYATYISPFMETFVAESMMPIVFQKIQQGRRSRNDAALLESVLLARLTGITMEESDQVPALSEKVLGQAVGLEEIIAGLRLK